MGWQVRSNALLCVLLCFLLRFLEYEFGDVPVEVVVCDRIRNGRSHRCSHEVGDHGGER